MAEEAVAAPAGHLEARIQPSPINYTRGDELLRNKRVPDEPTAAMLLGKLPTEEAPLISSDCFLMSKKVKKKIASITHIINILTPGADMIHD